MIAVPELVRSAQRASVRQTVHAYRVTKRDGTPIRVTDASQEVALGTELFEPAVDPGNDVRQIGLSERNSVVRGVVQSGAITWEDLASGQVGPGTRVTVFRFDRRMPFLAEERRCVVVEAPFTSEGAFDLDIVTESIALLNEQRGDVVTRDCRNQFGDAQCASALTTDGQGALRIEEWTIGLGVGPFPTVTQVTSPIEFRVAIPRATIISATTGIDLAGRSFVEFTTSGNHYLGGDPPDISNTDPLRIRFGIRGQAGGSPNLNGQREGEGAYASATNRLRVLETVSSVPSTLGFVGFEPPAGWFDRGVLAWRTGGNIGIPTRIRTSGEFVEDPAGSFGGYVDLVLSTQPGRPVQVGDTLSLVTGCTGTREVCAGKFGRVAVMRAEPTVGTAADIASTPAQR